MKHPHYQIIRAYADRWKIELKTEGSEIWIKTDNPCFYGHRQYRIVPDEDGWIPWYPHKQSECPVDPEQRVDVKHTNDWMFAGKAGETVWTDDGFHNITRYRPYEIEDEYAELKEAYERGETIQVYHITHGWVDITEGTAWLLPVDQYRIKPKTRKVKLLAYVDSITGGLTFRFEHRKLKSNWKRAPQLDEHGIEIEE